MTDFTGFPVEAWDFLDGLATDNTVAGNDWASLRGIVDRLLADGSELSEANRVRVPAPHPNDHPNADLLRRDGFHLSHTSGHPDALGDERLVAWTATELYRYGPLLDWLSARQVQPA
ncbi:MAG: hypothetical protein AB7Q42_03820 [Acidimicrobiia bacterium]